MKTILGLVCASALVLSVLGVHVYPQIQTLHQNRLPVDFVKGHSYVYTYNGRLTSGIAQLEQNAAAVLEVASDIVIQAEEDGKVALKMTNVRVGKHNGQMPEHLAGDLNIEHQEVAEYERELTKPIRFVWVDGQIKAFEALATEPEWSINIKKSILTLLNINLVPEKLIEMPRQKVNSLHQEQEFQKEQLVVYPLYEDGIGGICETLYEVKQIPNPWSVQRHQEQNAVVLNVTKTRNYQNCLLQPTIEGTNVDIRGAPVACLNGKNTPAIAGYYPMKLKTEEYGPCKTGKVVESPVEQYNFIRYNISQKSQHSLIEGIWSEGKTVLTTLNKPLMVLTQQNLTLSNVLTQDRSQTIESSQNINVHEELSFRLPKQGEKVIMNGKEHRLDIPYFHLFGKINFAEVERLIPSVLNEIAEELVINEISVSEKKTMQKLVQLNNAIAVLDTETLERLFVALASKGRSARATAHEQVVRKLFIDLIGTAGTSQTALLAKRLFENDMLSVHEAKELFEAIPQNLFIVDYQVIEEYLNLFLSERVQKERRLVGSVGVAFGKMIHEATAKRTQTPGDIHAEETVQQQRNAQNWIKQNRNVYEHQRIRRSAPWEETYEQELVKPEHIVKAVEILKKTLREASTFQQKIVIIETLAHMAIPEVLEVLTPYINDKAPIEELPGYFVEKPELIHEERNFVRQVTIYALSHVAQQYPQLVLPMLLPVYENVAEPYEVRIAAFTIALQCQPSKPVLERIASELHREQNRQVRSFVVSGLETAANLTQPMYQEFAENARFAVEFAPKERLGLQYSKMVGKDFYQPEKKFGLNYIAEWVSSNVSSVPRSGYFTVANTRGPFRSNLVEIGYNAKGIESILERLFEKNTLLNELLQNENTKTERRVPRSVEVSAREALEVLKQKLQLAVRADSEPKATVFMKMFERTSYMTFDRQYINELIDTAEEYIKEMTTTLMQGKSFHYVKLLMPNQLYKVVPSEMGLPVVVTERQPIVLSMKINKAKLQLETTQNSLLPTGGNLTVQMVPAVYHAQFQFAYAVTPATHETIGVQVEKIIRAALPMEISVGIKKNQLTWSLVPTVEQEVVHHQTKAHTFISKVNLIAGPKRDWLGEHIVIRTQPETYQYEKEFLKNALGLGVKVQVETENPVLIQKPFFRTETARKHGLVAAFVEMIQEHDDVTPHEVHVTLESDKAKKVTGFDFALRYARVEDLDTEHQRQENLVNEEQLDKLNKRQAWIWKQKKNSQFDHFDDVEQSENEQYVKVNGVPSLQKVFESIFGLKYRQESVKHIAHQVMRETAPIWKKHWTVDGQKQMPAVVAHNLIITGVARSVHPIYYGLNAMVVKSYDERTFWAKLNGFRHEEKIQDLTMKRNPSQHKEMCVESVVSYPTLPDEFYYEPTATQDLRALFQAKLWTGVNCEQEHQQQQSYGNTPKIVINGELQKIIVPEFEKNIVEPRLIKGNEQNQQWYKQQCEIDRANGQSLSWACEKAILDDTYFKRFVVEIKYQNVHPVVKNFTRKLVLATKVALYDELEVNERLSQEQNWNVEENKVRVTGQFNTRVHELPLLNVLVESPREILKFHNVHVPFVRPISALYPVHRVIRNAVVTHHSVDKCMVMENFVRTFDNVTVRLDEQSPCQYLVAKDCSSEEKFSVFARQLNGELKTKAVTVLVAGSELRLLPPTKNTNEVQVSIDGETVVLRAGFEYQQPKFIAKNGGHIIVYLREPLSTANEPVVVLKVEQVDLLIKYDGKNVMVEVGKRFRGQTCGVCGDNNNESVEEFTGPNECVYQREQDFVASYSMEGGHCTHAPVVKGPMRCPNKSQQEYLKNVYHKTYYNKKNVHGFNTYQVDLKKDSFRTRLAGEQEDREMQLPITNRYWNQIQEQKQRHQYQQNQQWNKLNNDLVRMRTHFVRSENQICFSNTPVRACVENVSRPVRMVSESVNFHCLPAQSISVQRLTLQAEHHVLEQFARKPVHMTQEVMLPEACIA